MLANYHTHTYHCHHADGEMRDYVLNAINNGLDILGFSDHVPYPFNDEYYSGMRMAVNETEIYVSEIAELREEFKGKIKIYTGYETEYYPKHFDDCIKNLEKHGYDYLILGQHFLNNEYDGKYSGTADEQVLKDYVGQVVEAIKTGMFSYIAHPDVVGYRDDMNVFKREMDRLLDAAVCYDIPLEFNLLGFKTKRLYPCKEFWQTVAGSGCKTVIGWDAHSPKETGEPKIYARALSFLEELGITPIKTIDFKKGEK